MTPEEEYFAKEARRLLDDTTFRSALSTVHYNALEALATADASKPIDILRLQAKAQVIDEVLAELEGALMRGAKPEDQPVP